MTRASAELELVVAELDCADEAAQIQGALGRLPAVTEVRTQNLWFTAVYNGVGVCLAGLGWLPPIGAAAAQSLPDVAVMLNASRLLRARSPDADSTVTRGARSRRGVDRVATGR